MIVGWDKGTNYKKRLRINSVNRNSDTETDANFTVNLGSNVDLVQEITLQSIQFSNVFYNLYNIREKYNNFFEYIVTGSSAGSWLLAVDPGRYTVATLIQAIQEAVAEVDADTTLHFNQSPIDNFLSLYVTTTHDSVTLRAPTTQPPGTTGRQSYWPCGLLGFTNPMTNISTDSNQPVRATYMPSLNDPSIVYLRSTALSPGYGFDEKGTTNSILIPINITVPYLSLQTVETKQQSLDSIRYKNPRPLSLIDIQLIDHDGDPLDLHGTPLNIECIIWLNTY